MVEENKEIILRQEDAAIVMPAVTANEALKQFKAFQEIKDKILGENDTQKISGNDYVKKTGWRKIKTIFNLSQEIIDSKREENIEPKYIRWTYKVRVKAKNGTFADAEMCCDSREKFGQGKPEAAVMAMAQTRAFNRAISDLVGGGEVSAEEMDGVEVRSEPRNVTPRPISEVVQSAVKEANEKHTRPETPKCMATGCGKLLTPKVYDYSMEQYGVPFCYDHQQEVKKRSNAGFSDAADIQEEETVEEK